jgi:hypothetical protein
LGLISIFRKEQKVAGGCDRNGISLGQPMNKNQSEQREQEQDQYQPNQKRSDVSHLPAIVPWNNRSSLW